MPENPPIIVNNVPTTKQQLISYGLGLAFTAASLAIVFGGTYVAGRIVGAREAKKDKNANQ